MPTTPPMTMRRATAKSSGWNMSLRASVLLWVLFIPTALFAGVNFDGVNSPGSGDDVLACGSDASVDNQEPFTIAAWIYPESTGEGSIGRIWRSEERRVGKECRSRWSP